MFVALVFDIVCDVLDGDAESCCVAVRGLFWLVLVLVCMCQGLREMLVVWCGNFVVAVPIQGVLFLYGGEVVRGVGVVYFVLVLISLMAGVVSGSAPSHMMRGCLCCDV